MLLHSPDTGSDGNAPSDADGDSDDDTRTVKPGQAQNSAHDPYANLDGAFGSYLADQPQPMANGRGQQRGDEEDLLF